MKQFVGEVMPGKISSVTNFGAFVTLTDVYVDGLIHISELGSDYFEFDDAAMCLRGRASGAVYRLNDEVKVKIAGVDSDTRRVDFVLVLPDGTSGKGTRGGRGGSGSNPRSDTKSKTEAAKKSGKRDERADAKPSRSSRQRSKR